MKLKILINLIITGLLASLIIWFRIFKVRAPVNISEIIYTTISILLILGILSINLIRLIRNIKEISKHMLQNTFIDEVFKSDFIKTLFKLIMKFSNAPRELYEQIDDNRFPFPFLYHTLASYLAAYIKYPQVFILLTIYLPQTIVSTIFIIDIFWFHQLNYFFKSLVLLLIPLLVKCYFYIVQSSNASSKQHWELYLNIERLPGGVVKVTAKDMTQQNTNYEYMSDMWFISNTILINVELWNKLITKFQPYFSIYSSLCYLLGWSFYLLSII